MFKAQNSNGTTFKGFSLSRIDDMIYNHMMDNHGQYSDWLIVESTAELEIKAGYLLDDYHNDGWFNGLMPSKAAALEYQRAVLVRA